MNILLYWYLRPIRKFLSDYRDLVIEKEHEVTRLEKLRENDLTDFRAAAAEWRAKREELTTRIIDQIAQLDQLKAKLELAGRATGNPPSTHPL